MAEYWCTVIGVETTGLPATSHERVVEIVVVYVSGQGVIQDRWSTLVNPQRDVGGTDIHGITATDVLAAPTFAEIAPDVLRAISGRVVARPHRRQRRRTRPALCLPGARDDRVSEAVGNDATEIEPRRTE